MAEWAELSWQWHRAVPGNTVLKLAVKHIIIIIIIIIIF